jgi:hypothetical protein
MASTYSTLKFELIGTGDQSGTWGTTTNTNLGTAIQESISGRATASFTTDTNLTISLTDTNATQVARNYIINCTSVGSLTATRDLIVPTINKPYIVENNTTGGQSIRVKTSAGTGVTIPTGKTAMVYADGTNVVASGNYTPAITTPSATISGGAITGTTISGSTGSFTTLAASSTVSGTGFSTYLASPPAIGGTAAAAGTFTTLAASSTVSGTGFSTYLASPPAIGGTAAAAGTFTTLTASSQGIAKIGLPTGSVLQVVQGTTNTPTTVASTTYTDTTLTATITPLFSTSKILVLVSQSYGMSRTVGTGMAAGIRIRRDSTTIFTPAEGSAGAAPNDFGQGDNIYISHGRACINYLDSPATTSATVYKTQGAATTTSSSGEAYFQMVDVATDSTSTIILMEIAA